MLTQLEQLDYPVLIPLRRGDETWAYERPVVLTGMLLPLQGR